MIAQIFHVVREAVDEHLQDRLDDITQTNGADRIEIRQVLDPFHNDHSDPTTYPAVIITQAPEESPYADFQVSNLADASMPIIIAGVTDEYNGARARVAMSYMQQAILHVLEHLLLTQPAHGNVRLINIDDIVFDFIVDDGNRIGGAVMFNAVARDET